jgi:[acyl-carrier-protein] S-malonyltransferase
MLRVAGAYHSPLMQPAADGLAEVLNDVEFGDPACPVLSNVTGRPHGAGAEIPAAMVGQVTSPVHWQQSVEWFQGKGVDGYVECGPGRVLSGLIKQVDKEARLYNIQDLSSLESTLEALRAAG